ncbi:hypothetical protein D3C72_1986940 [compost metagenome]
MREMLAAGERPGGRIFFLHGDEDPLASLDAAKEIAGKLGDRATVLQPKSGNHVMEAGKEKAMVLQGLDWELQK